ncbi:pig-Q [Malassezia nana]|uniref:Pig-Q n=1 Tax=Malassezia nana TaxID=180528 RepID=A0AAF0EK52_9BASI|nr:pig-Q [Malassezia nana]
MKAAALGAGAVTALTAVTAHGLARQYEASEAAWQTAPVAPPPPHDHWRVQVPSGREHGAPGGRLYIRIYWPTTVLHPGTLYGWILDAHGPEVVLVVAGVTEADPLPPLAYAARVLGTASLPNAPPGSATGALIHADLHTDPVTLVVLDPAWATRPLSVVTYTPPDVQRGQWLCAHETRAPRTAPWTRLEHLLAMDPGRRDEFLAERASGAPFRDALACMNVAKYVAAPTALGPVHLYGVQRTWVAWCKRCPPLPARFGRCLVASALGRAAKRRAAQLAAWPHLWTAQEAVHDALRDEMSPPVAQMHSAQRACWVGTLVWALDVVLGQLVAQAMASAQPPLAHALSCALAWIDGTAFMTLFYWLAHWPLGIKLNDELALFLSDVLGWMAQTYSHYVLRPCVPWIPAILAALVLGTRWLGVTFLFAAAADLLRMATMHLRLMYVGLRAIFSFFARAASELFDVFRSRKRNPLQGGRLDRAEHDVDQLFVGTILFTLLVFLFPTVFLYYLARGVRDGHGRATGFGSTPFLGPSMGAEWRGYSAAPRATASAATGIVL